MLSKAIASGRNIESQDLEDENRFSGPIESGEITSTLSASYYWKCKQSQSVVLVPGSAACRPY